jgi:hypothetical protein
MNEVTWPTLKEVQQCENKKALLAMALVSWAHCNAGNTPPEYFGEMMVVIGDKLGILPTPEKVQELFHEIYPDYERGE